MLTSGHAPYLQCTVIRRFNKCTQITFSVYEISVTLHVLEDNLLHKLVPLVNSVYLNGNTPFYTSKRTCTSLSGVNWKQF